MRVLFVGAIALASCGPPRSGADVAGSGCFPVAPMRLEALEHGSEWEPQVILEADGSVHTPKGEAFAHVSPYRVDIANEPLVCNDDYTVRMKQGKVGLYYDTSMTLVSGELRIRVQDDGEVEVRDGPQFIIGQDKRRARVIGDVKNARRTAEILVLLAMAAPKH